MVHATGAHQTNVESPETVENLCDKCKEYAKEWAPVADEEWQNTKHKTPAYENYTEKNECIQSWRRLSMPMEASI